MSKRVLTDHQISWAVKKKKLGYSWAAISEALYVSETTVINSVRDVYGTTKFAKTPVLPPLVYKEDEE